MLIQKNDGSNGFNYSWWEFRDGFGHVNGRFYWIGNNVLALLTRGGRYTLKFDLQAYADSKWYYAEYSTFRVLPESDFFRLEVSGYSGNAGYDAFRYLYSTVCPFT